MKKPSERIYEIQKNNQKEWPNDPRPSISAIIQFLDEEYEKNKPCKHKDSYQVDSQIGDVYYNVCNDCGVLFLANRD